MIYFINSKKDFFKYDVKKLVIGFFDALHLGHQKLFFEPKDTTVLTFSFAKYSKTIYDLNKRLAQIENIFHPSAIFVLNLDKFNLTSHEFVNLVKQKWNPKTIIVGSDFKFGSDHQDVDLLKHFFNVQVLERKRFSISTSKLKSFLRIANFKKINKFLLEPYSYESKVISGKQLARSIGFPTANFSPDPNLYLPPSGVYITKTILNHAIYPSITFIGYPITFKDHEEIKFETHILDYNGSDFYGANIKIEFCKRIANVKKYKSIDALKSGIQKQVNLARKYFNK